MKLKLDQQDQVTILSLLLDPSESLVAAQLPVLRAGLGKLALSGKTKMVLDLTLCGDRVDEKTWGALLSWFGQIPDTKAPAALMIASPRGPATQVGEAVEVIQSGQTELFLQLFHLRARRDRLQALQAKAQGRLTALHADPVAMAIKELKKKNAKLRREIKFLEGVLKSWRPQVRMAPPQATGGIDPLLEKRETLRRIIQNIFAEKKYFEAIDRTPETGNP